MPFFRSLTGSPVHVFPSLGVKVIEVRADKSYETKDPEEIKALQQSPEVKAMGPAEEPAQAEPQRARKKRS